MVRLAHHLELVVRLAHHPELVEGSKDQARLYEIKNVKLQLKIQK
jgi:hypothetical protein